MHLINFTCRKDKHMGIPRCIILNGTLTFQAYIYNKQDAQRGYSLSPLTYVNNEFDFLQDLWSIQIKSLPLQPIMKQSS